MTILNRSKGSYALESLQQGDQKYITTEFGTKIEEKKEEEEVEDQSDENDSAHFHGDVFVSVIGEFGKYQLRNVLLMGFSGFIFSLLTYSNKFLTYEVEYWCSKVSTNLNVGSVSKRYEINIDIIPI